MQCSASSQRNNIIKLTPYGDTKKRAYISQKVRAKENLKLSHDGSIQRQASGTRGLKLCAGTVIQPEA